VQGETPQNVASKVLEDAPPSNKTKCCYCSLGPAKEGRAPNNKFNNMGSYGE